MARPKEIMIFVHDKWEIAHIERMSNGRTAWHRRDHSWICDESGENMIKGVMPMPPKPENA